MHLIVNVVAHLRPSHVAAGGFSRGWHPRVWWPEERLFTDVAAGEVRRIEPLGSMAQGRVWLAIRADLTEDLQPAALYGEETAAEPEAPRSGPEF